MTVCPDGQVPLIADGCWNGACGPIASCDVTPACRSLEHEGDCLGRSADCTSVYTGINCTNSSGAQCMAGSTGCTCQDFQFATCRDRTSGAAAKSVIGDGGKLTNMLGQ